VGISYKFDGKHSVILVRVYGILTLEDIFGYLAAIAEDPAIPVDHVTLFDASEVAEIGLSKDDIGKISSFTQAHPSKKLIARKLAIVTRGDKETKLAEEYEKFAANFQENTIVFYHRDVACRWLGVPEDI